MEARNRATGNGNKEEWEQAARPNRTFAVEREFRYRRHLHFRHQHHNPQGQADNRTDFQESGQIVTRCEQQPNRQNGGDKAINHQRPSQGITA